MSREEIIPTKRDRPKKVPMTFRLEPSVVEMLDEVSRVTGHDRTAVLEYLVTWGVKEWRAERRKR